MRGVGPGKGLGGGYLGLARPGAHVCFVLFNLSLKLVTKHLFQLHIDAKSLDYNKTKHSGSFFLSVTIR